MYQATETRTERLRDEWLREFAASALEVLVDEAMCEYNGDTDDKPRLRLALHQAFDGHLRATDAIEWAAKLSSDVLSFESFQERELD